MVRVVWVLAALGLCQTLCSVLKEPPNCTDADCKFYLEWKVVNMSQIDFDLRIKSSHNNPWVAVAFGDSHKMHDSSVVECLFEDEVIVQASYNKGHKNFVLNNSQLGIIGGSTSGLKTDTRAMCNFTHVVQVNSSDPEAWMVKPLDEAHYVFMSEGRMDNGRKKKHSCLFVTKTKIKLFQKLRSSLVVAHGVFMVFALVILLNFASLTSRYFKDDSLQGSVVSWKPIWFQVHRVLAFLSATFMVVGILLIASYGQWKFYTNEHSILGLTVVSLVAFNLVSGMLRPHPDSLLREYFRYLHGFSGHAMLVIGCVTLYFGLSHPLALMPAWVRWVPIGFLIFRFLVDIVLTTLSCLNLNPMSYAILADNIDPKDKTPSWKYTIAISHVLVSTGVALLIVVALCVVDTELIW